MRRHGRTAAILLASLALSAACRSDVPRTPEAPAAPEAADAPASEASARPGDVGLADEGAPVRLGDLDAVREAGVLRVLIAGDEEDFLPRQGLPDAYERSLAREFAGRYGLKVRFVLVPSYDRLLPMLLEGRGDVVAAGLTETEGRKERVAFTRPTATVDEIVVARKDAKKVPKDVSDLASFEIHVRASSSYTETLRERHVPFVAVDEQLDAETLAYDVSRGTRPLTVLDSRLLEAISAYDDGLRGLFPIAEGRHVGWAVRKESKKLLAALDAFLMEKALTGHTRERFTGDLDGIRERGVLRVITRNNPVTYFLYRGRPFGFDYELAKRVAKELGVRLEMVVAPSRDELVPWLLEGRGDVVAASLTVLPDRAKRVAFSAPYLRVEEVLVRKAAGAPPMKLADLKGAQVTVRPSSSYHRTLEAVSKQVGGLEIVDAPESLETQELVAAVGEGRIPYTVSDSHILMSELVWRDDLEAALALTGDGGHPWNDLNAGSKDIAFAVRPDALKLKALLDGFVRKTYRGLEYNMLRRRYFESRRTAEAAIERVSASGRLSPYDALIKEYSARYGLDWRLMAALAYQESRFDPKAKSWVGAVGLFQVMPSTARAMGYERPAEPAQGVAAGIGYLHRLIERTDPSIPLRQRVRFALAGYNAGLGHAEDARRLAAEQGLDPDRWFGNVEKAMLLLEKPRYYRHARHGYCRGSEPVRYVSEIQNRYDNYVNVVKK